MIFIQTDSENRVTYVHYFPFDEINGLGKTTAELEKEGFLVESIPEPNIVINEVSVLYFIPDSKTFYYNYVKADILPTDPTITDVAATQTVIMEVLATMYEGLLLTGIIE